VVAAASSMIDFAQTIAQSRLARGNSTRNPDSGLVYCLSLDMKFNLQWEYLPTPMFSGQLFESEYPLVAAFQVIVLKEAAEQQSA